MVTAKFHTYQGPRCPAVSERAPPARVGSVDDNAGLQSVSLPLPSRIPISRLTHVVITIAVYDEIALFTGAYVTCPLRE